MKTQMEYKSMDPLLLEPNLDVLRKQAIKLHRRKLIITGLGFALCSLGLGGGWLYFIQQPSLEKTLLEQAGTHIPDNDIIEVGESVPIASQEELPLFKVQVMDDKVLYAQAEEAFLQRNWPLAIQKYIELIKLYPNLQDLWFNLALAYHHNHDKEKARYWYAKVLLYQPHHKLAIHNLNILKRKDVKTEQRDTSKTSGLGQS